MLVHRFLEDAARRTPDAAALVEPNRPTSYGQLDRLANKFAHLFVAAGVTRGDRVLIALDNSREFVAAYIGAMKAGGVAVPIPAGPRSDRLAGAVADCAPRVCLVDAPTAPLLATARVASDCRVFIVRANAERGAAADDLAQALEHCPDHPVAVRPIDQDLAAIIYTSGSTGQPRGVMLTHGNIVSNTRSIVAYLELTAADRVMCILPFHYVYGLSLLHTHLSVGGTVVIDNRFMFPNVVLAAMAQHRVTGFAGVPSTFALLLHRSSLETTDLSSLRYVTQAGGNMPAARIQEWLDRGPKAPFWVMYGATEASARLTCLPPAMLKQKLGSIGRPISNVEIAIVKDDGTRAAVGETGELVARGSNVACGYWNDPGETARKFGPGEYRTGDLGYRDEDGYIYLVGRLHDIIKVGAHRVGAKEIEDVLHEHPAVHDAAVVSAPHQLLGEVPVAFVVVKSEAREDERGLMTFCASHLAQHKVPARVILRTELPKLSTGKIDKGALRAAALESSPQSSH